jgi:phage gp16-like protein
MPKEFPKILDIYRRNGEKVKALREEVSRLESDILAEQRLKYSASNFETCIDGIE